MNASVLREFADEWDLNLRKDGGRKVMDGGDPYEDDCERVPEPDADGDRPGPSQRRGEGEPPGSYRGR